jgi:hypothetical protein
VLGRRGGRGPEQDGPGRPCGGDRSGGGGRARAEQ